MLRSNSYRHIFVLLIRMQTLYLVNCRGTAVASRPSCVYSLPLHYVDADSNTGDFDKEKLLQKLFRFFFIMVAMATAESSASQLKRG